MAKTHDHRGFGRFSARRAVGGLVVDGEWRAFTEHDSGVEGGLIDFCGKLPGIPVGVLAGDSEDGEGVCV